MPSENDTCPSFEGNSDFYGLGIRVGIYLQWFSSWISNTANPSAAATNHDTNTVFLCAILIATAVAFADGSLQLVEKYLLLLLSSGFFCTVLSFLGLRLHFLQPSALRAFRHASRDAFRQVLDFVTAPLTEPHHHNSMWCGLLLYRQFRSKRKVFHISFRSISEIRHHALSWAGVVVRSAVGCFLATLCLITWSTSPRAAPDGKDSCGTIVYFFGTRDLSGSMFAFFRVATIILLIPVGGLCLYSSKSLIGLIGHSKDWLVRYGIIRASEMVSPGAWDRLEERKKIAVGALIRFVTDPFGAYDPFQAHSLVMVLRAWTKKSDSVWRSEPLDPAAQPGAGGGNEPSATPYNHEFWNVEAGNCPPFGDLIQAVMSLFSRGVETREDPGSGCTEAR